MFEIIDIAFIGYLIEFHSHPTPTKADVENGRQVSLMMFIEDCQTRRNMILQHMTQSNITEKETTPLDLSTSSEKFVS